MLWIAFVFTVWVRKTSFGAACASRHALAPTHRRTSSGRSSHAQSTHCPLGSSNTESIWPMYSSSSSDPGRQYTQSPDWYATVSTVCAPLSFVRTSKPS